MLNKIRKRFKIIFEIDNFKTFCFYLRFKFKRSVSAHIFPNSIVKINAKGSVLINDGHFALNKPWYKGAQRKYCSELLIAEHGLLEIENDFVCYQGASIIIDRNAHVFIKGRSYLNTNSFIRCSKYIEIGYETIISGNVTIRDSDVHTVLIDDYPKENSKPVIIGNRVWIGENVVVLKGVKIGNGTIVASNSVVTKSFPENVMLGGNPAKIIREKISWQ